MNLRRGVGEKVVLFQMTPMIDAVFLLLIYFMSVTTFEPEEAELAVGLPAMTTEQVEEILPLEIKITISHDGKIFVNNMEFALPQLAEMLMTVQSTMEDQEPKVILRAHPDASHESVVQVLDACAKANLLDVSFPLE